MKYTTQSFLLKTIFRYTYILFIIYLKGKQKTSLRKISFHRLQSLLSLIFESNNLFSCRHLLTNSDFLLSTLQSPRAFKIKYFSLKHNLNGAVHRLFYYIYTYIYSSTIYILYIFTLFQELVYFLKKILI